MDPTKVKIKSYKSSTLKKSPENDKHHSDSSSDDDEKLELYKLFVNANENVLSKLFSQQE